MWKTSGREVILAFAMMEGKFFSEVSRLLASIGVIGKCWPILVDLLRNWDHLALGTQNVVHCKVKSYHFGGREGDREGPKKMQAVWS